NDAGIPNNDETESLYGGNAAQNDDATAELTPAEMIEANQMMVVFDRQLCFEITYFLMECDFPS
ncbi:unnamed protein product, partial [Rotaria socialis]